MKTHHDKQDDFVFTTGDNPQAQNERKMKERRNLEYNREVEQQQKKTKLEFLKTEDLEFGKA